MPYCMVKLCGKCSKTSSLQKDGISFHRFPKCSTQKQIWIDATKQSQKWIPAPSSVICSRHFKPECFKYTNNNRRLLFESAVPTLYLPNVEPNTDTNTMVTSSALSSYSSMGLQKQVSEQEAQPGPSKSLDTTTPLDSSGKEQDPLSRVIEQCRFCGEFSKDCVAVSSDMTYLAGNKTTLALNDTSVQLDFNDRSLSKTVCRDCDAKLQEFCDFVNDVKAAQVTLINVAEEKEDIETRAEFEETASDVEENAEYEETETLIVKTEYDSQPEDSDDDKEGIVDPLAVGETVFVKGAHKRKSDTDTAKPKKLKAKEKCDNDTVIDIKEEVIEKEADDGHGLSEVSDTGTGVKPSGP